MAGSFSEYAAGKILSHALGAAAWTMPTTYVALLTVTPTSASTGATITEANNTGYARLATAGDWGTPTVATPEVISNTSTLTFPACTAGSSTIIAFAILDSATVGAGNVIAWGTCTSTVISTTQTPPTFAIGSLSVSLTAS